MKTSASLGLILLLSLQCFYKLGVITYFQLNRDYIAEVLCINRDKPITVCQGQCFLDARLDLASNDTPADDTVPVNKDRIEVPTFLVITYTYSFLQRNAPDPGNSRYFFHTSPGYRGTLFHPPIQSCPPATT